jgi:hypothetical protein
VLQRRQLAIADPFGAAVPVAGGPRQDLDDHHRLANLIIGRLDRGADHRDVRIMDVARGHDLEALGKSPAGATPQARSEACEQVALEDRMRRRAADHADDHAVDELVALGLLRLPFEEVVDGPRGRQMRSHRSSSLGQTRRAAVTCQPEGHRR